MKLILLLFSITFHDACVEAFQADWPEYRIPRKVENRIFDYIYPLDCSYQQEKEVLKFWRDVDDYYLNVLDWWDYPEDLKEVQCVSKYYYTIYGWLAPDGVPYRPRQIRKFAWSQYYYSTGLVLVHIVVREVLQDTIFEIPEPMSYQARDQG